MVVMKCDDDDDVPTENENYDSFAGCCVIILGEDDTYNQQSPIQKIFERAKFLNIEKEQLEYVYCCIPPPPPQL